MSPVIQSSSPVQQIVTLSIHIPTLGSLFTWFKVFPAYSCVFDWYPVLAKSPCKNYTKDIWWLWLTFLAPEVITQQECLLANQIAWLSNLQLILCNQPRSANWVQQATNQHRSSEAIHIPYAVHCIPLRVSAARKASSSLKSMVNKISSSKLNAKYRLCIGEHLWAAVYPPPKGSVGHILHLGLSQTRHQSVAILFTLRTCVM